MVEPVRTGGRTNMLDPQRNYQLLIQSDGLCPARLDDRNFDDDFHAQFLDTLQNLAYENSDGQVDEAVRNQAIEKCSGLVGGFLKHACLEAPETHTQLDLVLSFSELTQLPFEMLKISNGNGDQIHLGDPKAGNFLLTRRIRGANIQESGEWPMRPRVLYVWAAAGSENVPPHKQHFAALRDAFFGFASARTFPDYDEVLPNASSVITELKDASLADIEEECRKARDDNSPYTHVHILAHGVAIEQTHNGKVYGVRLNAAGGGTKDVTSEELSDALTPMLLSCRAVTLAICNGGNETALLYPRESLAHKIHEAGFPVVVGSQFPLTFQGSEVMVSNFYAGEAKGQDVRQTLLEMRRALYELRDTTHDWAAVTPYVRLPEDYRQRLFLTSTGEDLIALEAASDWMKKLIEVGTLSFEKFEAVIDRVKTHAVALEAKLEVVKSEPNLVRQQFLQNEITGLIASAAKRRAEWWWELSQQFPDRKEMLIKRSQKELGVALFWYRSSAEDLNNHWGMMQAAAMEIILDGTISDSLFLQLSRRASENTVEKAKPGDDAYWAYGTLMECAMLEAHVNRSEDVSEAVRYFEELVKTSDGKDHPRATTVKTLERYQGWWTKKNGFFKRTENDLSKFASRVLSRVVLQ